MFRQDATTLADDLTEFLWDVFRGNGRTINVGGQPFTIVRDPNGGDFGDAVLLSHTVNEFAAQFGPTPPRERLPRLLRTRLAGRGIEVFNPRGRLLRHPCCSASPGHDSGVYPPERNDPRQHAAPGRSPAISESLAPAGSRLRSHESSANQPHTLAAFVQAWQNRAVQAKHAMAQ